MDEQSYRYYAVRINDTGSADVSVANRFPLRYMYMR